MKIALCQINPTVGAIDQNKDLILNWYQKSIDAGADLVIFPELAIIGYPPQDLLHRQSFIEKAKDALNSIVKNSTVPMIIGNTMKTQTDLYNCSFLCAKGRIVGDYKKMLLPTYDVFDEDRYFTRGDSPKVYEVEIEGRRRKIGLQICEDLWDKDYSCNLAIALKEKGADFIVNISASPYTVGRLEDRMNLIKSKVSETGIPFVYCNLVGAQDELIFDGQSLVFDSSGNLIGQGNAFEEDLLFIDLDKANTIEIKSESREEKIYGALVLGVRDYFCKTGHKEAVIGLSGGIDSSITACIAVDALGADCVHGV